MGNWSYFTPRSGVITLLIGTLLTSLLPSFKQTAKDSQNRPKPKKERIVSQPPFLRGKLLLLGSVVDVVGIDSHNGLKIKGRITKNNL